MLEAALVVNFGEDAFGEAHHALLIEITGLEGFSITGDACVGK